MGIYPIGYTFVKGFLSYEIAGYDPTKEETYTVRYGFREDKDVEDTFM